MKFIKQYPHMNNRILNNAKPNVSEPGSLKLFAVLFNTPQEMLSNSPILPNLQLYKYINIVYTIDKIYQNEYD